MTEVDNYEQNKKQQKEAGSRDIGQIKQGIKCVEATKRENESSIHVKTACKGVAEETIPKLLKHQ